MLFVCTFFFSLTLFDFHCFSVSLSHHLLSVLASTDALMRVTFLHNIHVVIVFALQSTVRLERIIDTWVFDTNMFKAVIHSMTYFMYFSLLKCTNFNFCSSIFVRFGFPFNLFLLIDGKMARFQIISEILLVRLMF